MAPTQSINLLPPTTAARFCASSCLALTLAFAMLAVNVESANGQTKIKGTKYDSVDFDGTFVDYEFADPSKDSPDKIRQISSSNRRLTSDPEKYADTILFGAGNPSDAKFVEFFDQFVFPSMTQGPNLSNLGEMRTKFLKDFVGSKVTGATRNSMIRFVIDRMEKYCSNDAGGANLHPAARLNAVYLIGMLDTTPANRLQGQAPVPSKDAFASLLAILSSNDKTKHPDYLKVAALAGLQRHVEVDSLVPGQIAGAEKQALTAQLAQILSRPETDDLNYWLKRRSMQTIGMSRDVRSIDTMIATLNSDAGVWLKYDAMEAIGMLDMKSAPPQKQVESTIAIADFLYKTVDGEAKAVDAALKKLIYDSILFGDKDLTETGTDYESASGMAATGGSQMGGMPGGGAGRGGGMGGGMGGGGFGEGGGAGGFGGGFSAMSADAIPKTELPNYQIHSFRRRVRGIAFLGRNVLEEMSKELNGDVKSNATSVVNTLNTLLTASYVGIVDTDEEPDEDEEPVRPEDVKTFTQELQEAFKNAADELGKTVGAMKGEKPPAAPADPAAEKTAAEPAAAEGFPGDNNN